MQEIRRSPVEVGSLSHDLQGFVASQVVVWISEPSTVSLEFPLTAIQGMILILICKLWKETYQLSCLFRTRRNWIHAFVVTKSSTFINMKIAFKKMHWKSPKGYLSIFIYTYIYMYTTNYNYICNVYTVHNNDISSKDSSAINTPNSSCSWELLTPQFCSCLGFWTALASCDLLQWLHWTSAGPAGVPTERPETPTRGKHTPKNHCVWNLLLSRSFFFVFIYHSWSFTNKNWQSDGTTDGFGKKSWKNED